MNSLYIFFITNLLFVCNSEGVDIDALEDLMRDLNNDADDNDPPSLPSLNSTANPYPALKNPSFPLVFIWRSVFWCMP